MTVEPPGTQPTIGETREEPFRFTGSVGEYFRIWIVNLLLSIVTLGIYSAWAKVRNKQYFYRHTRVEGSGFDYDADPVKILKGRILIGGLFALMFASQYYSPVLYGILLAVFMVLSPWLAVKAFAFNARNSSFRNVRFGFAGPLGEAYKAYLLFPLLGMLTLGGLYPYALKRAATFYGRHHRLGTAAFAFDAPVGTFYRVCFGALGIALLVSAVLVGGLVGLFTGGNVDAASTSSGEGAAAQFMLPFMLALYGGMILPSAYFAARAANLFWGNLSLGDHQFRCTQRFRDILWLYVSNLVAILFTLGLAIPWAKNRMAHYRAEHMRVLLHGPLLVETDQEQRDAEAYAEAASDFGDLGFDV